MWRFPSPCPLLGYWIISCWSFVLLVLVFHFSIWQAPLADARLLSGSFILLISQVVAGLWCRGGFLNLLRGFFPLCRSFHSANRGDFTRLSEVPLSSLSGFRECSIESLKTHTFTVVRSSPSISMKSIPACRRSLSFGTLMADRYHQFQRRNHLRPLAASLR